MACTLPLTAARHCARCPVATAVSFQSVEGDSPAYSAAPRSAAHELGLCRAASLAALRPANECHYNLSHRISPIRCAFSDPYAPIIARTLLSLVYCRTLLRLSDTRVLSRTSSSPTRSDRACRFRWDNLDRLGFLPRASWAIAQCVIFAPTATQIERRLPGLRRSPQRRARPLVAAAVGHPSAPPG